MISNEYIKIQVEQYIQDSLEQGIVLTKQQLTDYITNISKTDFSVPQFNPANATVNHLENASASKENYTYQTIRQDLTAIYREIIRLSTVAMSTNDRWLTEAKHIEKQLIDLDMDVSNLLLRAQDTQGFFATVGDNFTDTSLTDTSLSTAIPNVGTHYLTLQPVAGAISRVLLNFPTGSNLVSFKLRTGANQTGSTDPTTIFNQVINPWKVTASSTLAQAVTGELNVQVNNPISQIKIDSSSAVQVTPMTSTDNINWIQLPGVTTTQSVTGTTTFVFPTINPDQASNILWVKFILTKQGPDYKDTNAMYNYEFGFNSISFWYNTFQPGSTQSFYSIPLWAADSNGNPIQFSKMALQTCEQVEDSTSIRYYLTTSNDPLVPVTTSTLWSPISPIQYSSPQWPTVLDINNIVTYEYPLTSGTITAPVIISYNISGVVTGNNSFKNPASGFYMITSGVLGPVVASGLATSGQRFHAGNPDNYILNYQIDQSVNIDPTSLELFRNVGQQGLVTTSGNNTVRGTQIGWGFDGQNYNCVVLITNPAGVSINFGPTPLVIDGTTVSGQVNLTGATTTTNGIHSVSISPNAWQSIPSGLTTYSGFNNSVSGLDRKLYPFNQKLLIEGYAYPSGFIGDPSIAGGQPYNTGIALFAEYYMKEVSPFDMINNIAPDGFQYFAQDSDIPASHNGAANTAQTVFVVKVDTDINDWLNEQFVLSFKLADQLVKYLRFRADMKTDTPNNTPALANYTIKLGT